MATEEKKTLKLAGLPWWPALAFVVISVACIYLGIQSSSVAGTLCSAVWPYLPSSACWWVWPSALTPRPPS